MQIRIAAITLASLLTLGVASSAVAWEGPDHPRINEINQRLANQRYRIAEGMEHGQIGPWQARRDLTTDWRIRRQLTRDEAMHYGHITLAEQRQLNRELNWESARIYDQRH
jgi:hypothetical protein